MLLNKEGKSLTEVLTRDRELIEKRVHGRVQAILVPAPQRRAATQPWARP